MNCNFLVFFRSQLALLAFFLAPVFLSAQEREIPAVDLFYPDLTINNFQFGSCIEQRKEAPVLRSIIRDKPDVFFLIGDNIYQHAQDPEVLKEAYARQKQRPLVKKLFKSVPVSGVWDDNDYGKRDGGKEYLLKKESKEQMLSFFDVPAADPRRFREGVYFSVIYGKSPAATHVIVLDTRWFRDDLRVGRPGTAVRGPYVADANPEKTMLGEMQWEWLKKQLQIKADRRFIVSSIQVIPYEHGFESWGNFPVERQRLLTLTASSSAPVIFLSGDRHHAEISAVEVNGKQLTEITSSSLNLPRFPGDEPNEFRVSDHYRMENYGELLNLWKERKTILSIKDKNGKKVLEHAVSF